MSSPRGDERIILPSLAGLMIAKARFSQPSKAGLFSEECLRIVELICADRGLDRIGDSVGVFVDFIQFTALN